MGKMLFFRFLKNFVNAFISGIVLGLFCIGFVFSMNSFISYLCLGMGLLISMLYGYDSFLIQMPYVLENKIINIVEVLISFIGNFVGILLIALMMKLIPSDVLVTYNQNLDLIEESLNNLNYLYILILGFLSGIIIYFGINTYKKAEQPIARFLALFICGALVTYLGNIIVPFQMFYLGAFLFKGNLVGKFFTIVLANILGELLIPLLRLLRGRIPS